MVRFSMNSMQGFVHEARGDARSTFLGPLTFMTFMKRIKNLHETANERANLCDVIIVRSITIHVRLAD